MREANLYLPIIRGANAEGWRLFRIEDGSRGKKPFDIGGCDHHGRGVAMEIKIVAKQSTVERAAQFPWTAFAEHQRNWLVAFGERDALALAVLYFLDTNALIACPVTRQHAIYERLATRPRVQLRHDTSINAWLGWRRLSVA